MASHILMNFFVIFALVFIASANEEGGYKVLEYGEEFPAHSWHDFVQRARPRIQRRQDEFDDFAPENRAIPEMDFNRTVLPTKRTSSFEEMNKLNNFRKESGVKVIYSRMPMPFILVSSYPKTKRES